MNKIIDGKKISLYYKNIIKKEVEELKDNGITLCLAVILIGKDPASLSYIKAKKRACAEVFIDSKNFFLEENVSQITLENLIDSLNIDKNITAILLQLPLPKHLNTESAILKINPEKDVDGLNPVNIGKSIINLKNSIFPCTPLGILKIFEYEKIKTDSLDVCIIGRSNLVSKPLANALSNKNYNASVVICHSKTKNIMNYTLYADIIIVAVGSPNFLEAKMIKENSIVIDVGINRIPDTSKKKYKIVGDSNYDAIYHKVKKITPVPGGVGPMTIAMLLKNTLQCFKKKEV